MVTVEVEMHDLRNMATKDLRQTALDRFWQDMLLAPEGDVDLGRARYDAGVKLAHLHEATGLRQRESGSYEPRQGIYETVLDHPEACDCSACRQLNAFGTYQVVVRLMGSAGRAVVDLCIHENELVDRRELVRGLDVLVNHWGLD